MMTMHRPFFLPGLLILGMACTALACSGSGVDAGSEGADATSGDAAGEDDTQGSTEPDRPDVAEPEMDGEGMGHPFADCVAGMSSDCRDGVMTCMASETCTVGLDCMGGCPDSDCAMGCMEGASDEDGATLEGLATCAAFAGCFGIEPSPGDPVCGDGSCDEGEDADGCPDDCTPADTNCLADNCAVGNCLDVPECAVVIECMAGCGDVACATECIALAPPEAQSMLGDIASCGEEAGCFEGGPVESVCGDDMCDDTESCESCADDCGACTVDTNCCGGHDGMGCDDDDCMAFICEMDMSCCTEMWHDTCAETAVAICDVCVSTGPVCGDSVCDEGEDEVSCAKDCAEEPPPGSCIADNCDLGDCQDFDICAEVVSCMDACPDEDCAEGCLLDAPPAVVGLLDEALACGVAAGCFEAEPPPIPEDCLVNSCDTGNCEAFPECVEALGCMADCTDAACAEACILATPATFQVPLYNLLECGVESGCYGAEPMFCGDGACDEGETEAECPEDCTGATEYYGVLIQDAWDGECGTYSAAGADIASVELLTCLDGDPGNCVAAAYLQNAFAEVGTEGCQNSFTDPSLAEGPCGCNIDNWLSLQGGWMAGDFGPNATVMSGMVLRVHEYGVAYDGIDDPFSAFLFTEPDCMDSDDWSECAVSIGMGIGLTDFVVP